MRSDSGAIAYDELCQALSGLGGAGRLSQEATRNDSFVRVAREQQVLCSRRQLSLRTSTRPSVCMWAQAPYEKLDVQDRSGAVEYRDYIQAARTSISACGACSLELVQRRSPLCSRAAARSPVVCSSPSSSQPPSGMAAPGPTAKELARQQ